MSGQVKRKKFRPVIYPNRIKQRIQANFQSILGKMPGKKFLILSEDILGKLSFVVPASIIKKPEFKVETITRLHTDIPPFGYKKVVYIVSPKIRNMKIISDHYHAFRKSEEGKFSDFHIVFLPRITEICTKYLKQLGIKNPGVDIVFHSFSLDLIPFDEDLLSLECPEGFREMYVNGDMTIVSDIVNSLQSIQNTHGVIPSLKGLGPISCQLCRMMMRKTKKEFIVTNKYKDKVSKIDQIFFIDREMDMMSPFLTQLTYEGLIDEFYGIRNGYFTAPELSELSKAVSNRNDGRIFLNPLTDNVFREIRDLNQIFIGRSLANKEKEIKEIVAEKDNLKSVKEMKEFVKTKLRKIKEERNGIKIHFKIFSEIHKRIGDPLFRDQITAEQGIVVGSKGGEIISSDEEERKAKNHIRSMIHHNEPLWKVLRLLCLISFVKNGLAEEELKDFQKLIYVNYGFEKVFLLRNLKAAGLLKPFGGSGGIDGSGGGGGQRKPKKGGIMKSIVKAFRGGGPSRQAWTDISKLYRLVEDSSEGKKMGMTNIHQVFASIAPLSVRFSEIFNERWLDAEDQRFFLSREKPQKMDLPYCKIPKYAAKGPPMFSRRYPDMDLLSSARKRLRKVVILFYVGGVTYAEVNAIRYLNGREKTKIHYIVATTKIINGKSFIEAMEDPDFVVGNEN